MAYLLQFHDRTVVPYLLNLDLSRQGRVAMAVALHRELRIRVDAYMNNPQRRLAPGSNFFQVDVVFRDHVRWVTHELRFILSDEAARYGILRVLYVEDETKA